MIDPRVAAQTLLITLARYRQKDVLPILMPYILSCLTEYNSTPHPHRNYLMKDAVLVAIGALAPVSNIVVD